MRTRTPPTALSLALLSLSLSLLSLSPAPAASQSVTDDDILYDLTDEEYYSMPELFVLDDQERCQARGGGFCLGDFELSGGRGGQRLLQMIQHYSANWVDYFNHSRLHRGLCLPASCPPAPDHSSSLHDWFSWCVNATMQSDYNLSATPLHVSYCRSVEPLSSPLSAAERSFAAAVAALLAVAAISTVLDVTLADHVKKAWGWALSWSVVGCWRSLQLQAGGRGRSGGSGQADLRALDGLRVLCMMCVIIEHVCWLATQHYIANTREFEMMRRSWEAMLMANSTLVVQIFFLMSSFLMAHKLLQPDSTQQSDKAVFGRTMLNRIIRLSPLYWAMVWFASQGWQRLGSGPLWGELVGTEVAICQRKWWTHLLYLNNVISPDDKCLIQTWYLAADMQLYALSLLLTLRLRRLTPGRALQVLVALLVASLVGLAGLAYAWRLVPTFAMHNPELVRRVYSGEPSFNVLYQSPLGNSPGALLGLILAFGHHALVHTKLQLHTHWWFRFVCAWAPWVAVMWAGLSPALLGDGPPSRAAAAALAALERPVFAALVAAGILGSMHHVDSPLRSVLSWRGWVVPARLGYAVLLLHMPLNKGLVAARSVASTLNRKTVVVEWFGVALWSYAIALPLALLIELPPIRLHQALSSPKSPPPRARSASASAPPPSDKHTLCPENT